MSPEQLGRLVDEHAAALVLYARQWCTSPEDIVQEAFLRLVSQRTSPVEPVGWLFRVIRNSAISAARAQHRRGHHERAAAAQTPPWFLPSGDGHDVKSATEALQEVDAELREIIVAHLWGGLTFEQIGNLIGTSSSSAHRSYVAGLTVMRNRLGVSCPSRSTNRD